jgi:hypothetical protein
MSDQSSKTESSPARRVATKAFIDPPLVRRTPVSAKAVGSFVPRLTRKAMEKFGFSTAALLTDWSAIVGPDLAHFTKPHKLKWPKGVETWGETPADQAGRPGAMLILSVDAARALEVQYKTRQIIERINAYFGYRAVAEMRIEQVPTAARVPAAGPRGVVQAKPWAPRPSVDLGQVADERLRAALERIQKGIERR